MPTLTIRNVDAKIVELPGTMIETAADAPAPIDIAQ